MTISGNWALIPLKGSREAKSRLSPPLDDKQRAAIRTAMLVDVLEGLQQSRLLTGVALYTPEPEIPAVTPHHIVIKLHQPNYVDSLNIAVEDGARRLISAGADMIAVLPADLPLLDGRELDLALAEADATQTSVVIPDRWGEGTNGIVFPASVPQRFRFGTGSFRRHLGSVEAGPPSRPMQLGSFAIDIDTPADLLAFGQMPPRRCGSHTRSFIEMHLPAHTLSSFDRGNSL